MAIAPSRNVTLPVGVPPLLESVAVSVTGLVAIGVVVLAAKVLVLVARLIVSDRMPEVLA